MEFRLQGVTRSVSDAGTPLAKHWEKLVCRRRFTAACHILDINSQPKRESDVRRDHERV